ncbi:GroES-like protein [Fomitiporia mediterranea MF3/22]|uniref:GroES-like protein n=1 Tax=Fomitiporia mediterranea (strain MF3/22) TaxID=694068 RepID=UPI000440816B|nr:GroES-like protein [Fomitiporia mediterranea MF3/22]EJC99198.1 GroES-like protein [Fomitiporia mediterranea MF3/22]
MPVPSMLPTTSAAVCYGPTDLRIETRPLWPPAPGEATIKLGPTGLCGSDLHYYTHGRNGDFALQAPLCLGHEAAGIVTALGPGVSHLRVGQRVAIECGIMCNKCGYCEKGRYNLCKGMRFCSSAKTFPHLDGTLQERMNHPAHLLHPIPDNVPLELAALAEPLSVLIHAARRVGLSSSSKDTTNKTVLVFGVGAIGLLACALARAHGASRIVALDINPQRLHFAQSNGLADATYCLPLSSNKGGKGGAPQTQEEKLLSAKENIMAALQTFDAPDGFDIVFECTGAETCIQMSVHACTPGGRVMLIGMGSPTVTLPLSAAATREVDLLGSFRYANTYPEALSLLSSGTLKGIEKLITHRFDLSEAKEAFELMRRGRDEQGGLVIKVLVGGVGV